MQISVITPTYNRGKLLQQVYDSLVNQTDKNFEWIVIDDGSTDNTSDIVNSFIKEKKIKIKFHKKENGGKHTAVNHGLDMAEGDFVIILDSDDRLLPDAVKIIKRDASKYNDNIKICGMSYLKRILNGTESSKLPESPYFSNHIQCRYNEGYLADRAEVYKVNVLKKYKFPIFEDERFLSEAIVWNKIAYEYDTVYVDEYIYECEYQQDGLTANSQKTRVNNPIGAKENYRIMMKKPFKFPLRVKYSILYNTFSKFAGESLKERLDKENKILILLTKPLGDIAYLKWKKYKN